MKRVWKESEGIKSYRFPLFYEVKLTKMPFLTCHYSTLLLRKCYENFYVNIYGPTTPAGDVSNLFEDSLFMALYRSFCPSVHGYKSENSSNLHL